MFLIEFVLFPDFFRAFVHIAAAAYMVFFKYFRHTFSGQIGIQVDKQLPDLFLQAHGSDSILNPGDIFIL